MKFNQQKIVAIIPAYEPPHAFIDYAKQLLSQMPNLVVVNDGSNQKYQKIFDELAGLEGCTVISYPQNHGKGYALKTAFKYCKQEFDNSYIFVTADCDGQHLLPDVINVCKSCFETPTSLHLGSRDFYAPNVPKRSKAGNIQTRRLFRFLYGIKINDTQTGLRAFSYDLLDRLLAVKGNRFEYEMNMLIQMKKHNIAIIETPIATIYEPKPDDVEKVSHYKTFSDSMRVLGVLFSNIGWYFISSALSAILDVVAFYLFSKFVFTGGTNTIALNSFFATVCARVVSSIFNFTFNYKFVFNGKRKSSVFKYYLLWCCQLTLSFLFAFAWNHVFTKVELVTICKGAMDLLVAIVSYQIQQHWVFAPKKQGKFYGSFFKFARFSANLFKPRLKYKNTPKNYEAPVIYICRHLNMHGPFTIARSFKKDVHMFVLHSFFTKQEAYNQFLNNTFKNRKNKKFLSKMSATFVPKIINSSKAIPVYRGKDTRAILTIKTALKYLCNNEPLAVFPDIEYTNPKGQPSDIYSGFIVLDKYYFNKTGKHILFVPLVLDDKKRTIIEREPICFVDTLPFETQIDQIKQKIVQEINIVPENQQNLKSQN